MYNLYDYTSPYSSYSSSYVPKSATSSIDADAIGAAIGAFMSSFMLVIVLLGVLAIIQLIAKWIVFKKAGRKPWESLIPVHSDIVVLELGGIETYWYFLNWIVAIPFIGWFVGWIAPLILAFWSNINLAKSFGKSAGFGVLMTFFPYICLPILAFGSAQYVGPQVNNTNVGYSQPVQPNQDTNVPPQQ